MSQGETTSFSLKWENGTILPLVIVRRAGDQIQAGADALDSCKLTDEQRQQFGRLAEQLNQDNGAALKRIISWGRKS